MNDPDRDTLLARSEALPEDGRRLLQLCALVYEPATSEEILRIVHACGLTLDGKPPQHAELDRSLEDLTNRGLLVLERQDRLGFTRQCSPRIADDLLLLFLKETRNIAPSIAAIRKVLVFAPHLYYAERERVFLRSLREARFAIALKDMDLLNRMLLTASRHHPREYEASRFLERLFNEPFREELLAYLTPNWRFGIVQDLFFDALFAFAPVAPYDHALRDMAVHEGFRLPVEGMEIMAFMLQGRFAEAYTMAERSLSSPGHKTVVAWIAFLRGDHLRAVRLYEESLKDLRRIYRKKKEYFKMFPGLFHVPALAKAGEKILPSLADSITAVAGEHTFLSFAYGAVLAFLLVQQGSADKARDVLAAVEAEGKHALGRFFTSLVNHWTGLHPFPEDPEDLRGLFRRAEENGYRWIALETARMLAARGGEEAGGFGQRAEELGRELGIAGAALFFTPEEDWQRALKALAGMDFGGAAKRGGTQKEKRLIWLVDFEAGVFEPRQQVFQPDKGWSAGKNVALKRLKEGGAEAMTEQDLRIVGTIRGYRSYYNSIQYEFDREKILPALVGHPFLFSLHDPSQPVELQRAAPELHAAPKEDGYELEFSVPCRTAGNCLVKETESRYRLCEITADHVRIAEVLGAHGRLKVPSRAKEDFLAAVAHLSSFVTVHAEVDVDERTMPRVPADARLYVRISPRGNGLKVELLVKPFATAPPYFTPGAGSRVVMRDTGQGKVQTRRDLRREEAEARELLQRCPTLELLTEVDDMPVAPAECLDLLSELEDVRDRIVIEWPEGVRFRLRKKVSLPQLSVRIAGGRDWFGLSGGLAVDEGLVVDLRQVLAGLHEGCGRFVPIGEGEFLELSQELRRRLDDLKLYTEEKKDGLRFHPLRGLAVHDLLAPVPDASGDGAWEKHLRRIRDARSISPAPPASLQTELRDYQVEGYRWLARLAAWGVGACLADDMGLGKTIQAMALLIDRAQGGPALVVAPASVVPNWASELVRFAPTLQPVVFGGRNRTDVLEDLTGGDVLLVSYGLLQTESELLAGRRWTTIVLDEAQAIKNAATKTAQAALALSGDFRLTTTGTPIQNHLGELWTLFQFLNPGFLGDFASFQERFVVPAEKNHAPERSKQLRRLIQPFILRRTKAQVLDELPEKTEITLFVDLSPEEAAFYEAVRQNAVARLEGMSGPEGQQRIRILAEITRLRQASCHPRLLVPEAPVESAKLALFGELVDDLRAAGHKALVFSQFVGHLALVRAWLDAQGVPYQYLDGSTPVKERTARVRAFQRGAGDLFLISLKAGGLGLNLTAADYVLHLDPWWNPAVEDQASDRAHRIGQQRPVTVYRLIAKNTIEEKILALHRTKRDLSDHLLEGTDMTGKISAEELLRLITER